MKRVNRVKYMMTEGDYTLGSECTTQYTDAALWNCIPETDIMLLTIVTLINLI